MRFLVAATPKIPPAPERMPAMIDAAEAWQERHSDKLQDFGLFPGGGGFGIAEVPDEATLHSMLAQMPRVFLMLRREWNTAPGPPFSPLTWVEPYRRGTS